MNRTRNILLWGILTLFWTGLIFWFSLQPAAESASLSGGLLNQLLDWIYAVTTIRIPAENVHWLFRKTAHFGEFFLLGIFSGNMFFGIWKKVLPALLYGGGIAVLDECLQFVTGEGRAMRVSDMLLDFFGVLCAVLLLLLMKRFRQTKKSR